MKARLIKSSNELGPFMLRLKDRHECELLGFRPSEAVAQSIAESDEAFAVEIEDQLLCVWGYRVREVYDSQNEMYASDVWLLTTPLVNKYPISFVRESQRLLKGLLAEFHFLRVEVWEGYKEALAWLERLGFEKIAWSKPGFFTMVRV